MPCRGDSGAEQVASAFGDLAWRFGRPESGQAAGHSLTPRGGNRGIARAQSDRCASYRAASIVARILPRPLVTRQFGHEDDIAGAQLGGQRVLDMSLKSIAVARAAGELMGRTVVLRTEPRTPESGVSIAPRSRRRVAVPSIAGEMVA